MLMFILETLKPIEEAYCEWEYPEELQAAKEQFDETVSPKTTEIHFQIDDKEQPKPQEITMKIEVPETPEQGSRGNCLSMVMDKDAACLAFEFSFVYANHHLNINHSFVVCLIC